MPAKRSHSPASTRRGRPPSALDVARRNRLVTVVTDEELLQLSPIADESGESMSALCHRVLTAKRRPHRGEPVSPSVVAAAPTLRPKIRGYQRRCCGRWSFSQVNVVFAGSPGRPDRVGLSPSIPDRSKRLELGFPGGLRSCSESAAVEPGEGQMGDVG